MQLSYLMENISFTLLGYLVNRSKMEYERVLLFLARKLESEDSIDGALNVYFKV